MGFLSWLTGGTEPEPEVIEDACTILAVQDLIEDKNWQPRAIIEHVKQNHGMLNDSFDLVEHYAPVASHNSCSIDPYEDGGLSISSERGDYELEPEDRLVVTYETTPGRGHSECIRASEFEDYASLYTIKHIFTRE